VSLAPLVWKQLLGEPLGLPDLAEVDRGAAARLAELQAAPEALWPALAGGLTWSVERSDGSVVELAPGGRARAVQPGERAAFCAAALRARLQESAAQCSAMREGLHSVVPAAALGLLPWWRLERGVAGSSAVSAAALRATSHVTVDSRLEGSPPNPFPRAPARGGPARRKATPGPCSLITSPLRAALHRVRGDPASCL
jgi:hypothetical protein